MTEFSQSFFSSRVCQRLETQFCTRQEPKHKNINPKLFIDGNEVPLRKKRKRKIAFIDLNI